MPESTTPLTPEERLAARLADALDGVLPRMAFLKYGQFYNDDPDFDIEAYYLRVAESLIAEHPSLFTLDAARAASPDGLREAAQAVVDWRGLFVDIGGDAALASLRERIEIALDARDAYTAALAQSAPEGGGLTAVDAALAVARRFDAEAFACDFAGVTSINLPNLEQVIPLAGEVPS